MPNPFNDNKKSEKQPDFIIIEESVLTCEFCFLDSDKGIYYPNYQRLQWTCPNGHKNEIRNIDL